MPDKILIKAIQLGLGVADITREQVEKFVTEVTVNKDVHTKEGRKMVNHILKQADKARKNLDKKVETQVKTLINKYDLATKKDVNQLEKKLKKLKKL